MIPFRVNDVRNFTVTARSKTLTEAARKLEISQPALSESIKNLEQDLNCTLFYRSRSGISLTTSGREFYDKAKLLVEALENFSSSKVSDDVFQNKTISIGCHPTVAQYSLPSAFTFLEKRKINYSFSLHHGLSREIQQNIQAGRIDIGVVINPVAVPDLVITPVGFDNVAIWSSDRNSNQDVLFCDGNLNQTQSLLKKLKTKPSKIIETSSLELICEFTNAGLGLGLIPERVVRLRHPKLKMIANSPIYKDQISIVYRPEFGKNQAEKLTVEALKSAFLD